MSETLWLDCRDFGTVGDGVADDTAALQQALNALTNNARGLTTLRVPKGTYRVTQTLYMPVGKSTGVTFPDLSGIGPVRVFGDGPAASRLLVATANGRPALDMGGTTICPFGTTVEGFSFIGSNPPSARGIVAGSPDPRANFFGGTGLVLKDLHLTGFTVALSLSNVWGSHVVHCFLNHNVRAIDCMDAHYSVFERCEINGLNNGNETDVGIGFYPPGGGVQSTVSACAIRFCKQGILTMDGIVNVVGCQFDDCGSYATALSAAQTFGCLKIVGSGFTESFNNGGVWTATNGFPGAINCDSGTAHCVDLENCMFEWGSPRPLFSEAIWDPYPVYTAPKSTWSRSFPSVQAICVWGGTAQMEITTK